MKIVCLDARIFEEILSKTEQVAHKFSRLKKSSKNDHLSEWMDGQDVCTFLRIKPRTLQTLRDNGTLVYTQIEKKIFYKKEDVNSIIKLIDSKKLSNINRKIK